MKKPIILLLLLIFTGVILLLPTRYSLLPIFAIDPVDELQQQIDDLEKLKKLSEDATKPLEKEIASLNQKIKNAQASINQAKADAEKLASNIDKREEDLADQIALFSYRVSERYKRSRTTHPLLLIFASQDASQLTRDLAYFSSAENQDKTIIQNVASEINGLEKDKTKLENDQKRLAQLQEQFNQQKSFFEKEVKGAKTYQEELSGKIASLSARQQEILNEKSGTFSTTVGDVPPADDLASRPDYNPGFSPAFAAFSFGAPHFKGLSQFGAFGRAKSGQNVEEILKAYYGSGIEIKKDYPNETIVLGRYENGKLICDQGSVDLETYAKRIYEVPSSWGEDGGLEALKAQAVAAKSYALATVKNKGCICMTESCQVYKPINKGGKWEEAVNATFGWVMIANGSPLWAQYASTSGGYQESYTSSYNGGYTTPNLWDTKSGRSGWTTEAFEKIAGSPWFYKGWYKDRAGDSCGRFHPWLTSEEMADILNGWKVLYQGGGDGSRVTPIGHCWEDKHDNPYSKDELKNIGGFTSVSSVSVSYSDSGVTANVVFQTNKGSITISGQEFYKVFNLRAPGKISLKSGLFNIEQK